MLCSKFVIQTKLKQMKSLFKLILAVSLCTHFATSVSARCVVGYFTPGNGSYAGLHFLGNIHCKDQIVQDAIAELNSQGRHVIDCWDEDFSVPVGNAGWNGGIVIDGHLCHESNDGNRRLIITQNQLVLIQRNSSEIQVIYDWGANPLSETEALSFYTIGDMDAVGFEKVNISDLIGPHNRLLPPDFSKVKSTFPASVVVSTFEPGKICIVLDAQSLNREVLIKLLTIEGKEIYTKSYIGQQNITLAGFNAGLYVIVVGDIVKKISVK